MLSSTTVNILNIILIQLRVYSQHMCINPRVYDLEYSAADRGKALFVIGSVRDIELPTSLLIQIFWISLNHPYQTQ